MGRTRPPAPPRRSRRSTTSSASSSATSTCSGTARRRQPDQDVDVNVAVVGAEPVSFSYTSPSTGTAAPFQPALRDRLMQSALLIPLVVALVVLLAFFTIRSLLSLRQNKQLVSRLGDFVTLPAEERAAERRKEVDQLLAAVGSEKQRKRNFRWMEGFSEDVDVAQIKRQPTHMIWASVILGLALGLVLGVLVAPIWFFTALAPPVALNLYVRNRARKVRKLFAEQLPENLDVLASALRAGHSLAGAMGVVADEAPGALEARVRRASPRTSSSASRSTRRSRSRRSGCRTPTSTRSPSSRSCSARRAATRPRCSTR